MKILWHSNASFAASGYGKQTKLFAPRLQALGHDVAMSAFAGLQFAPLRVPGPRESILIYPKGLDGYGNDVLEQHAADHFGGKQRDGLVITLTDIWVLHPRVLKSLKTAAWVPVDHEPCQPPTITTLREGRCIPIAMSRFGERMLKDEGLDPVYVPHGVDTTVFKPLDRRQCRAELGFPTDGFIVGMVAANQGWRKSFPQAIRAFARFRATHPDATLYLHTWLGTNHSGVDLHSLVEQELTLNKLPREAVHVCDQYRYSMGFFGDDYLAKVYSALDVLMNPAQGEGFGVPIIEAQACGTPVILTNSTAMSELCGSGALVGGTEIYTQFGSWQLLPDIEHLQQCLEYEYERSAEQRLEARQKAREFALTYDADLVTEEFWKPALAEIEQRIAPKRRSKKRAAVHA